ncbi:uncharacterized protein K02A2.6-like [Mercenaria mercenaria]|uniref:uncharacterized protein K02A2.6-like n=1 Tax=Mercenaria mercenaria TaxID=6596 RepID=UPI001E1E1499|nr:uncharacterized protein K02A2.6-like [Mercenaria mercenaria]
MSTIVQPLTELLCKDVKWNWTKSCKLACETVKQLLTSSTVLVHYQPEKSVTLAVDASPYGLGAVISHEMEDGLDRPIAYASRTLTTSERNYSQIEKEALAIIFGIQKFHQFLYARKFILLTDSKPLSLILGPKKGIPVLAASRLQRWAIQLSAYQYDIRYRSTTKNGNADTLSRFPLPETMEESNNVLFVEGSEVNKEQVNSLPVTPDKIAKASRDDPLLSRLIHFTVNGWPARSDLSAEYLPCYKFKDEFTTEEGCLLRGIRVVIPSAFQNRMLEQLHDNHPEIVKMKSLARMHMWWLNVDTDIECKVKNCVPCQQNRSPMAKTPPNPWRWPGKPWQRIHIDYAGPFMNKMYLIVVDAHSKWLEVITMASTTSESTINALRYLFSSYGLVEEIVSDNGPQFVSAEFQNFVKMNGIKHIRSATYHPSSNGEAERAVCTFKTALKTMSSEPGTVNQKVSRFLLSYRSTPHSTTQVSPAELFLGRRVRTRLDIMRPDLSNKIQKKTTPKESQIRTFQEGDSVWIRDYRQSTEKWVDGIIVHQLGPVTYKVKVGDLIWKRHVDQIRMREPEVIVDNQCSVTNGDFNLPIPLTSLNGNQAYDETSPDASAGISSETSVRTPIQAKTVETSKTASPVLERYPKRSTRGFPPKRLDL